MYAILVFLGILQKVLSDKTILNCNGSVYEGYKVLVDIMVSERKLQDALQREISTLKTENNNLRTKLQKCTPGKCSKLQVYGLGKTRTKISASSEWNSRHGAHRSVLHTVAGKGGTGAWSAKSINDQQYLQFEFPTVMVAAGTVTQGRNDYNQWVTKYRVFYSLDCMNWKSVNGNHVFAGNSDRNSLQKNYFQHRIKAKCIRINPTAWHGHISMRADVIGCPV